MLPDSYNYPQKQPATELSDAVQAFSKGKPVLIHDADERENEVDLVYPAHTVTASNVVRLHIDAGGLICVALSHDLADEFELPFLHELIDHPAGRDTTIKYDDRPSFSLTVNHSETFTGIVDNDRARTIAALGDAAIDPTETDFADEFDTPGHVHLLKAVPNLLKDRQGHTELSIALAELADLPPAVAICEMLDDETGGALSHSNAERYASKNDLVYLNGASIIDEIERK